MGGFWYTQEEVIILYTCCNNTSEHTDHQQTQWQGRIMYQYDVVGLEN